MDKVATRYNTRFINHYYDKDDEKFETVFKADSPEDIKTIISALSAYFSGDECECFINGKKAVLESDRGLL